MLLLIITLEARLLICSKSLDEMYFGILFYTQYNLLKLERVRINLSIKNSIFIHLAEKTRNSVDQNLNIKLYLLLGAKLLIHFVR